MIGHCLTCCLLVVSFVDVCLVVVSFVCYVCLVVMSSVCDVCLVVIMFNLLSALELFGIELVLLFIICLW